MLDISVSKFHELVPVVEYKDPHHLHAHLEQTVSESHLQNSTRHTTFLWYQISFFNDDFGRLTGTEPLFRGIRVEVIDPFYITCDNSPDTSVIHGITYKLVANIHSMLTMLRCQFMRYRSTASVWFSKCLNLTINGIIWCTQVLLKAYEYFSCGFTSKILGIFSLSHNWGLSECIFFFQYWNVGTIVPHAQ